MTSFWRDNHMKQASTEPSNYQYCIEYSGLPPAWILFCSNLPLTGSNFHLLLPIILELQYITVILPSITWTASNSHFLLLALKVQITIGSRLYCNFMVLSYNCRCTLCMYTVPDLLIMTQWHVSEEFLVLSYVVFFRLTAIVVICFVAVRSCCLLKQAKGLWYKFHRPLPKPVWRIIS